jgi:hypothetical protein
MGERSKQQKAANLTVAILAIAALVIYVGFYFLVANGGG